MPRIAKYRAVKAMAKVMQTHGKTAMLMTPTPHPQPDRRCGTCADWDHANAKPSNVSARMIAHCLSSKPDGPDSVRPASLKENNTRMKMYSIEGTTCPAWQPKESRDDE